METEVCIICKKSPSGEESVYVKRGIAAVIDASKERGDGIWEELTGYTQIQVHKICRKEYTRSSTIKSLKRHSDNEEPFIPAKLTLRSTSTFDYKTCCLFCSAEALALDPRLAKDRMKRKQMSRIETFGVKESILAKCAERADELAHVVRTRVENVDLIANEARYHFECYSKFRNIAESDVPGRKSNDQCSELLNLLFEYITDQDECQYSIPELKQLLKSFPGGDNIDISEYILKSCLQRHFGEKVIVTEESGRRPALICFLDVTENILYEHWYTERKKTQSDERLRIVETVAKIIREDIRKKHYDLSTYPSVENMLSGGSDLVPQSLELFTKVVLESSGKKKIDR